MLCLISSFVWNFSVLQAFEGHAEDLTSWCGASPNVTKLNSWWFTGLCLCYSVVTVLLHVVTTELPLSYHWFRYDSHVIHRWSAAWIWLRVSPRVQQQQSEEPRVRVNLHQNLGQNMGYDWLWRLWRLWFKFWTPTRVTKFSIFFLDMWCSKSGTSWHIMAVFQLGCLSNSKHGSVSEAKAWAALKF